MPTTLTARTLITGTGSIDFPVVTLAADGTIAEIGSDPRALAREQDILTPAFFDIHTHGAMNHDVMFASPTDLGKMQRFLATHGTAHYLPTTVTAPIDTTLHSLEALANAVESTPREREARPVGIHLEGPFLSHAKRGVHPADQLQPPSIELFDRFQQAARGHIRLLTLAPELPGALDLIRHATSHGVRVSLGHTNALAADARAAIDAGATSATHTFNAMRALDHREPGVLGVALDDNRLFAELICDGIHVAPELVRLWLKAKGPDRAILVTDAMSAAGMPEGNYKLGELDVTVAHGRAFLAGDLDQGKHTLAGSVLTLDKAIENLHKFTSQNPAETVLLATKNPSKMLNLPELTRLAPGSAATLNRLASGRLTATYIRGQRI
ncbi:MAG TPA: N-acetylglucosamine-6-phosphate deacetylase [Acidobacteriaceae bacterium]|jgi:N-acetylglucosamine-6-phosphate deacetylase|nr:N-acetylglucosamine-6-phosphate deacetylase [Acidobacteriaceae bacterium]